MGNRPSRVPKWNRHITNKQNPGTLENSVFQEPLKPGLLLPIKRINHISKRPRTIFRHISASKILQNSTPYAIAQKCRCRTQGEYKWCASNSSWKETVSLNVKLLVDQTGRQSANLRVQGNVWKVHSKRTTRLCLGTLCKKECDHKLPFMGELMLSNFSSRYLRGKLYGGSPKDFNGGPRSHGWRHESAVADGLCSN